MKPLESRFGRRLVRSDGGTGADGHQHQLASQPPRWKMLELATGPTVSDFKGGIFVRRASSRSDSLQAEDW